MKRGRLFLAAVCSFIFLASGLETAHANNYSVTYDANANWPQAGVTSGSVPSTTSYASGALVTAAANTGNLARQGFTFAGWNTASDGSGSSYAAGTGTFTIVGAITLYAKWTIPQSARLIGSGGSVLNITNPNSITNGGSCTTGGIRGVTSDGTNYFVRPSSQPGYICKVNSNGYVIEVHNVGGILADSNTIPLDSMAISYSSGCIFIRGTGLSTSTVYCIDVSDWTITARTLSAALADGQGWGSGNLINFPDGRIGSVSKPGTGNGIGLCSASALNCKILKLFNVIGSGKSVTFTTSEDLYLADSESGWPSDDHGIATDGTYLYEIMYSNGYKVWALQSGAISYLVFNGAGTGSCGASGATGISGTMCPINAPVDGINALGSTPNVTYIGHNHVNGTYIMGDYNNPRIYLSNAVLPPTGPGSLPTIAAFNSFGLGSGLSTAVYRATNTITVNLNTPSKVTFYSKGKAIPGCKNLSSSGTSPNITATCNWKPAAHGYVYITVTAVPTNTAIATGSAAPLLLLVAARSGNR